jgi:outer membrane lipopolysaccharide assembly protein LptE/RlpB
MLILLWAAVSGCGYQLSGQAGSVPDNLRQLAIPMFVNATPVPGLERLFTAAVRERFQRDGRVRLGSDVGLGTRLQGEITRYELTQILATTRDDRALEYRIQTELHITVVDRRQGQIVLQQPLIVTTEYVVSERIVPTDIARDRALQTAAQDAGERVVSLLLDRF